MEIRVLGPVEAWSGERKVSLIRRQQRLILGLLALEANRLLPRDSLVDLMWGERPPASAPAIIQSRISEIRAAFGRAGLGGHDAPIVMRDGGYVLCIDPDSVDAHRFSAARILSQQLVEPDEAARSRLRQALRMWRGPMLGGLMPEGRIGAICQNLEASRVTALEDLFDIELRLGNHLGIADEVAATSAEHPTRERLVGQMMVALHRAGRSAEALIAYDRWRRWLSGEFGIDPGTDVQATHMSILQRDPEPRHSTPKATTRCVPSLPFRDLLARASA
jgi:DNA-binding SARP family transcriptional activator